MIRKAEEQDAPRVLELLQDIVRLHHEGRPDIFSGASPKYDEAALHEKFRNENELMESAEDPESFYINVIMQEKLELYLEYVQNASFWYDSMK